MSIRNDVNTQLVTGIRYEQPLQFDNPLNVMVSDTMAVNEGRFYYQCLNLDEMNLKATFVFDCCVQDMRKKQNRNNDSIHFHPMMMFSFRLKEKFVVVWEGELNGQVLHEKVRREVQRIFEGELESTALRDSL